MKILIAVSCIFAVASAASVPLHVPVFDAHGFQVDTADVAHRKASHFAAHDEANARIAAARAADVNPEPPTPYVPTPYAHAPAPYTGPLHYPVLTRSGVPVETPEVVAAKADHAAAYSSLAHVRSRRGIFGFHHTPYLATAYSVAPVVHTHYTGPVHVPVIDENGVPVETPEVVAARASHAATFAETAARDARLGGSTGSVDTTGSVGSTDTDDSVAVATPYTGEQHVPVLDASGVPVNTPEVAAARASHAAAHAEATSHGGAVYPSGGASTDAAAAAAAAAAAPRGSYPGPIHVPVIDENGVPVETPEVKTAKVGHAVAHADATARNAATPPFVDPLADTPVDAPVVSPVGAPFAPVAYSAHGFVATPYTGAVHVPVIGPNGVPLDTPEVAAGKVANAVAHAEATARASGAAVFTGVAPVVTGPFAYSAQYPAPVVAARTYTGPIHIPVIGPNGVPLDTPEVAAGKVADFNAHIEAKLRNGDLVRV